MILIKSKKILLFIVEGITDQTSLAYILSRIFHNQEVRFIITGGDVTTQRGLTSSNIAAFIGNLVRDFSGRIFTAKDFSEIVHLVDLDGTFISPEQVEYKQLSKPFYTEESIQTSNISGIQKRNKHKAELLNRLTSLHKVWKTIPYSVYFFSCNLDHVLHQNANLTNQEKMEYARQFEEKYAHSPMRFLEFLENSSFSIKRNYEESWQFIRLQEHSLQSYTNFNLYFTDPFHSKKALYS